MESPAGWSESDRLIQQAIDEHDEAQQAGGVGFSLARVISDMLESAGLLEPQVRVEHNHFTRDFQPETCAACANTRTGQMLLARKQTNQK